MRALSLVALLAVSLVLASCASSDRDAVATREVQNAQPARVLRHMVFFKFKDDASAEQVQEVVDAFRALPGRIDAIHAFEWGTDVSPEGLAQGHTHAFLLTFRTEADRDAYLPHPAHKEFGQKLRPILDKVTVVDYWAQP